MQPISLLATASYLPEKIIENDFFGDVKNLNKNVMFSGVKKRRHVSPGETAASMIEKAGIKLIQEMNLNPLKDIDILMTSVTMPDEPFMGCGAVVSHRLGAQPRIVLDIHNAGCISFIYMMDIACSLIRSGQARNALICNVQNTAGNIFAQSEIRKKPQSVVPGDGCGIGYLSASSDNPILTTIHRCYGEYAADMSISSDDGRKYWEPGLSQFYVDFPESKIALIMQRGNTLVPAIIREACDRIQLSSKDIDALITNQPNTFFLRNWREALELPAKNHFDTFSEYGNLFGAGIPVTLDETLRKGKIQVGNYILLGGFSHAGDFAAAAAIRWGNTRYSVNTGV